MDDFDDLDTHLDHDPDHDLDHRILSVLHAYGADPRVASAVRGLSLVGEHGALWLGAGLVGATVDGPRRRSWLRGTALVAGAHLACMGMKRLVRRVRPAHVEPRVRTAGRHSFPSAHAASSTAAAVAFGTLGTYGAAPLATAVCLSRLVAGVHYPSDVVAGAALGALTARLGARWMNGARA